jgi:hypothetical protein
VCVCAFACVCAYMPAVNACELVNMLTCVCVFV